MEKTFSYFVVMIDYGKRGREAIVDPEITRREVVSRIQHGKYDPERIASIHFITMNDAPQDMTVELIDEARALVSDNFYERSKARMQAAAFDRARALRQEA